MLKVRIKLDEVLKSRGISQTKLSKMINTRQATISDMCRNARQEVSFPIIEKIAHVLNITDLSELMRFEEVDEDELT